MMQQTSDCYGNTYPVTWKQVDGERYREALEALPPIAWTSKGFLLGEAWTHKTCNVANVEKAAYHAFARIADGTFFECVAPLTVAEFKAMTTEQIMGAIEQ
jgi:hypothetical protein